MLRSTSCRQSLRFVFAETPCSFHTIPHFLHSSPVVSTVRNSLVHCFCSHALFLCDFAEFYSHEGIISPHDFCTNPCISIFLSIQYLL